MIRALTTVAALALVPAAAAQDPCACDAVNVPGLPVAPVTVERVYDVQRQEGMVSIRFGDGLHGAVPPTGTSITATYRAGTGGGATVVHVGGDLSASVVTVKPALVALPEPTDDEDEDEPGD